MFRVTICRSVDGAMAIPKGPCTLLLYTWAPKSLYRKYFKAQVYNNEVHGPLGYFFANQELQGGILSDHGIASNALLDMYHWQEAGEEEEVGMQKPGIQRFQTWALGAVSVPRNFRV